MTTTISRRDGKFSCIARLDSEIARVESARERDVGERRSGRIRR